ncbi:PREDICTED: collagen alpha-2(IV) chain-like [Branchiostoma belcheri]|uniref:Collagen alpha-2(IV) chain-like n=1 Tax=Branchiostoma belcheri TaxID=7741 RepID=A0A6P5AN33_BRABE|nr:PREDICTED: collagen alpha-2(IV) chain-like [Branchiostoma belcheri]
MTSEKLPYGHLMPERSTRRERTGGPLGSLVGVLGAAAVFVSAVVLAVIVQNIGHEMGNLRAKIGKLQAQGQKDHDEMAKLQEKVATLATKAETSDAEIIKLQAQAQKDHDEIGKLQAQAQKDHDEIGKLQAQAQRDHDDMAKLQARAEKDQEEVLSLRERIVVLETQVRGATFLPNYAEQQQMSHSPEGGQSGHVGEADTGGQNNNATVGGLAHRRSKRDSPNWVRLPSGSGRVHLFSGVLCCENQPGRDGRDGRDGMAGAPGLKGESGQKGDIGLQGHQGAKGQKGAQGTNGLGGAVYVRWGRKTCPSGATTVYSGVAGGEWYDHPGGGTNYQCLPTDPQWGRYQDGVNEFRAFMFGAEYQLGTNVPFGSTSLHNHNVPCAVCYVPTRGSKLMIPARNTCYSGWTREYHGYLMAERHNHAGSKEFVCVDEQPEVMQGGHANQDGALFYPVEARCGSLPCPHYVEGRELTCVVCTK